MSRLHFINLSTILDDFAKKVKNNEYKKVDYNTFRNLSQLSRNTSPHQHYLKAETTNANLKYKVYIKDPHDNTVYTGVTGDKSFADYLLYEIVYKNLADFPEIICNTNPIVYNTNDYNTIKYSPEALNDCYNSNIIKNLYEDAYTYCISNIGSYSHLDAAENRIDTLESKVQEILDRYTVEWNNDATEDTEKENETKENKKMNFKFDFGPTNSDTFRMSPYGIAIHTGHNGWVAYNAATADIVNVNDINFAVNKMIYKMPVPMNMVNPGDIVLHSNRPFFVKTINTDGTIRAIDYDESTVVDILPVKSPFGFNFFTKIVPLFDMSQANCANPENPFGNILPFLMMNDNGGEFDPTIFFLMNSFGNGRNEGAINPLMMYCLMNSENKDNSNVLPLLFAMNPNFFNPMQ